jgi:aspartyl-tRNA(Asn)/glutamyl-tRNA(Gln) amidotransferase subunit C
MLSREQIEHLAKLARLKLNEEEIKSLTEDLNKILNYVKKIEELNLENIEPSTSIIEKLDLREDEVKEKNQEEREKIIDNFPQKENNYLKVPKILEK